jgi:hypothetical protein
MSIRTTRAERLRDLHRFDPVVGGSHLAAHKPEHHRHRGRRIPVVVHHQDASPGTVRARDSLKCLLGHSFEATLQVGAPHCERVALCRTRTLDGDDAAVHLDQPLHERQPDAESAGEPLDAPAHLGEHVEAVTRNEEVRGDHPFRIVRAPCGYGEWLRQIPPFPGPDLRRVGTPFAFPFFQLEKRWR